MLLGWPTRLASVQLSWGLTSMLSHPLLPTSCPQAWPSLPSLLGGFRAFNPLNQSISHSQMGSQWAQSTLQHPIPDGQHFVIVALLLI